jgi:23S rRNA pseudouridine2605 synthase
MKRTRPNGPPQRPDGAPGLQTRGIPLARALSKRGLASRKDARALILAGRVRVNGRLVKDPSLPVTPERARIEIDTLVAPPRAARRVIAFHKPRGVVTTRRDPEGRPTVFDVLGDAGIGLVAVGRLDRASTGLLLFTNDTQLAHRLTDPANRVVRRYVATVRGRVDPDTARRLEQGVDVRSSRGSTERLAASRVEIRKASNRETHLIVELTEGKNREVRRLFDAAGHEVTRLHRIAFGEVELGTLQPGQWRDVLMGEWEIGRLGD